MNGTFPLSPYATSAYDAVWTIALTINETFQKWKDNNSSLDITNFDYKNGKDIMIELRDVMQNLSFEGLSVSYLKNDHQLLTCITILIASEQLFQ